MENTTNSAHGLCNSLLCCPECNSPAITSCVIETVQARGPFSQNHASATCKICGFQVSIATRRPMKTIRIYWDNR